MIQLRRVLTAITLVNILLPAQLVAQDLDYLNLADTTLAVVADMPTEEMEAELDAVSNMLTAAEREKRDADFHADVISRMIESTETEIKISKEKGDVARAEERTEDYERLQAERKALETKKDFFERAKRVREAEERYAAARVDYIKRTREMYEKALELMGERRREGRERDLLILELEFVELQREAADRMRDVGSRLKRVGDERKRLYELRERLIEEARKDQED